MSANPYNCTRATRNHKTIGDHSKIIGDGDGRVRVWTCSACGLQAPWGESWTYLGNLECVVCQTAAIEFVACSKPCAQANEGKWVRR